MSKEIPNCPPSKCQQLEASLRNTCQANGWAQGREVLVVNAETGEYCFCECPGPAAEGQETDAAVTFRDCTDQECAKVREKLHRLCHDNNWPPGHKVLVCFPERDECCLCTCH